MRLSSKLTSSTLTSLLASLSLLLQPSQAVFSDDAFHIDYHHALLGAPQEHTTFFHRPDPASSASLVYTLSERGFVGAVNPKDGSLVWRRDLLDGSSDTDVRGLTETFLRAPSGGDVVVAGAGAYIGAFDGLNGRVAWERKIQKEEQPVTDLEILEMEGVVGGDVLVLLGEVHGVVRRLDVKTGETVWEWKDDSSDIPFQVSSSSTRVFYISHSKTMLGNYKFRITVLDPVTGIASARFTLGTDSDLTSLDNVLFAGANTAAPILAWTDKTTQNIKVNVLGFKPVSTLAIDNKSGEQIESVKLLSPVHPPAQPHFLVHYRTASKGWAEVYHTDLSTAAISKAYKFPLVAEKDAFAVSTRDANVYFVRVTESQITLLSSVSHGVLGKWLRQPASSEASLDEISFAAAEVVSKADGSYAVRFVQAFTSGDWGLVHNGASLWSRPESLAGAVVAEWAEPTIEAALAHELDVEGHQNVLAAYVHRVNRHTRDLIDYFPGWIAALPYRIMSSFVSEEATNLEAFGLSKIVIVATEAGRVIGLDTGKSGQVVWNVQAFKDARRWNPKAIFVSGPIASVFAEDGSYVKVAVASGEIIEKSSLGHTVKTLAQIPGAAETLTISVSEDGTIQPFAGEVRPGTVFVTLGDDGKATGWRLGEKPFSLWTFRPATGQKLVHATARPAHDPVASIGKVLGDRSVLYKYLNPNLALMTATTETSVTLYLIDSITGQILYTATHKNVDTSQPITSTMSENWFAYSFFSDVSDTSPSKGYQLIVAELYESPVANDRGPLGQSSNFSSLHSVEQSLPHVIAQSYLIAEGISHMAVSQTQQGITVRQLLCTLSSSNAIVGIPRHVLNPRRILDRDPTALEQEEGLFRYAPFLDLDPRWYLTHAREVMGIRAVKSSPTLLESTSLIFAFGEDIFGTRIAPSSAFDILGKGFNKVQLVLTVLGLGAGVFALAPMIRSKQIMQRWKMGSS